ncbi:MAG: protein kinase domain-containing protein [Lacipirellulaceae bacterium]
MSVALLRPRQKLGKYVIEKRLAEGGFAVVYRARDTIEGIKVAIKVPHDKLMSPSAIEQFQREARLVAQLEHPNLLPLKSADVLEGRFVMVTALGVESLGDRLERRLAAKTALEFVDQMLEGLAYAHERSIAHCDVKPDNFILFPEGRVRLADFGIARVAQHTLKAGGEGTIGYIAPEQALGSPSLRSDVFSMGITLWRMFSGQLPSYPFEWPMPGHQRIARTLHEDAVEMLRKATHIDPRERYADAVRMKAAFERLRSRALLGSGAAPASRRRTKSTKGWRVLRRKEFLKRYKQSLAISCECPQCEGPLSEAMTSCPWCGDDRSRYDGETKLPQACPRCSRGMKLDWSYCPWCYGPGFQLGSTREFTDKRYSAKCRSEACERKSLMPFMRYCPWCHTKVHRRWSVPDSDERCDSCGWGVVSEFWSHCPWCSKAISSKTH